jgi:hypothetical protein
MPLTDQALQPNSLSFSDGHWRLSLGLPWFRALPLASIEFDSIRIGSTTYSPSDFEAETAKGWITADWHERETDRVARIEWFVQDRLSLRMPVSMAPTDEELEVEINLKIVTPNLFHEPGKPITIPNRLIAKLKPVR